MSQTGKRLSLLAASGLAMLLAMIASGPVSAGSVVTREDVKAAIPGLETYIAAVMTAWQTPGIAIGIVAEDELVYARGFGIRRAGSSDPVDAETVFQIGSTTKAFLGVTQAMMVADGKLAWTDRVIDHAPDFRLADSWVTREFRIDDLIAQRSGLPFSTLTNTMLYGYPGAFAINGLRYVEPVTSFRSTFAYQNAFHLVAGNIVARKEGMATWEDVLQARLLDPLGMASSSCTAAKIKAQANHAEGHRFDGKKNSPDPFGIMPYNTAGAGCLNSSIRDLARWVRFQINEGELDGKRLIDRDALNVTREPRVVLSGPIADDVHAGDRDTASYATGWIVHGTPEGRIVEHAGGTVGFVSHIGLDPDRRFGVIVLVNQSLQIGHGLALPLGKYVLDRLQGRPVKDYAAEGLRHALELVETEKAAMTPPTAAIPARPMTAYEGTYRSPVLGTVDVRAKDGSLRFLLGPNEIPVTLAHWSGDIFVASIPVPVAAGHNAGDASSSSYVDRIKLQFLGDSDGKIARFDWLGEVDASGQPPFVRVGGG